ncbi:MAG: GNAT family N-acetyltransferase [Alphaproteobacteria bacterium]|nr:GNAT family N-acetyltransferase [Alphaproteobacteria bacterium]
MAVMKMEAVDPAMALPLAALHLACFEPLPETPWSEMAMLAVLRMPGVHGVVASLDDGVPAGFMLGREMVDEAEILTMCVMPRFRRDGLAQALLQWFFDQVPNATRIVLEVVVNNEPAISLYESAGFRRVGLRLDYYGHGETRTNALIMARARHGRGY